MRTLLKVLGGLVIIILVFLLWALKTVDYNPYFNSSYYSHTRSQLDSLSEQLEKARSRVHIGFARESITPQLPASQDDPAAGIFKNISLAGYGSRKGAAATGIHDSVFVKAVALKVDDKLLVLIGSDLLIVPPEISAGVAERLKQTQNLQRSQLFFSATHTHSSMGAWSEGLVGESFAGPYNPQIVAWLIDRFCMAVQQAVNDLKPGSIGTGTFEAPDLVENRLVGSLGQKNAEFVFLIAEQDAGKKAILGSFDGHATILGAWNLEFSGDYPGYWQRKLETDAADMAIFFAGSVGSHRAVGKGEKFERARYIGEALADSVSKYSADALLQDTIDLSYLTVDLALPEFHIRLTDGLRLNPTLGKKLFPPIGQPCLQTARIGDLIWATAPCDFSGESAIVFKNAMRRKGYKAMVTSFNGGYVGYIIPCKYYHLNEYESRTMSWFGPYMGPYTNEMIGRMMNILVSK